tara:strand:- start:7 stop:567 length:561 start_codon:yes stop_codon:yes gene_type:complete
MRITVQTNVDFKKLKRRQLPKLIFDNVIKGVGRAALQQVKKTFTSNQDINGKTYAEYSESYKDFRKAIGVSGKPMMQLTGNLKNSIPIKIFTNPQANRVIIRPDFNRAKNSKGEFYGAYHLNGRAKGGKIRKWFYTSDEIQEAKILLDDNLLGKNFKAGMKLLEKKIQERIKGKMRVIAGRRFDLK